jgi:hypothetical protein
VAVACLLGLLPVVYGYSLVATGPGASGLWLWPDGYCAYYPWLMVVTGLLLSSVPTPVAYFGLVATGPTANGLWLWPDDY